MVDHQPLEPDNFWEEREFVKKFDQCPACGCQETTVSMTVAGQIRRLGDRIDFAANYERSVTVILSPIQQLTAPALVEQRAYCARCGCAYARESKLKQMDYDARGRVVIDAR